jgi:hypothetical protein
LLAASLLDIVHYATTTSPTLFRALINLFLESPSSTDTVIFKYQFSLFIYVLNIIGVLTSIPAVISGVFEAYALTEAKGLDFSNPVIKTMVIHAGLNDLAIVGGIYNWLSKRYIADFASDGGNAFVSSLVFGGVAYAAFLGGGMVYTHGTAVQRQGKGKAEKEQRLEMEEKQAKKDS